MSELDDLPSWAGRSTEEVRLPADPPKETPVTDDAEPDAAPEPPTPPSDGRPDIAAPTAAAQAPPAEVSPPPSEAVQPAQQTEAAQPAQPAEAAQPAQPAETVQPVDEPVPVEQATQPSETPRKRSRLRRVLLGLLGLAILAGAAAIGYAIASQDSDATEASGTAPTDADDTDEVGDTADPATDEAGSETESETAAEDADGASATGDTDPATDQAGETEDGSGTVTVQVDGEDAEEGDAGASGDTGDGEAALNDGDRQAIFRGGQVYLSGAVPSEEIGAAIVAKAEAVVGPGNVINEYVIDPSTTIEPGSSAPLYVEDVVLFEFNSIEIATPFLPILDLGTLLLRQNPQASVTVVTRTDAVGSEEVNLEVATARAQAVINYWLRQGVDADQIIADPRGEEGASEDDDAETAARQRRAEFIITGLLD